MSTQLAAMKTALDFLAIASQMAAVAGRINEVLKEVHDRGTPWNDEDQARVDSIKKESEDRLLAVRKSAGFI